MGGFNKLYLIPLAVVVLAAGIYYAFTNRAQPEQTDGWRTFGDEPSIVSAPPAASQTIKIYITGAVESPDVYELPDGSRVKDAVDAAGGAVSDAALDMINLSARISDEDHIIVPRIGESTPETIISNTEAVKSSDGRININTATNAELQTLSGIGPVMAGRIIEYRETNGGFKTIDEIKNVERVGEKTFEAIEKYITVE